MLLTNRRGIVGAILLISHERLIGKGVIHLLSAFFLIVDYFVKNWVELLSEGWGLKLLLIVIWFLSRLPRISSTILSIRLVSSILMKRIKLVYYIVFVSCMSISLILGRRGCFIAIISVLMRVNSIDVRALLIAILKLLKLLHNSVIRQRVRWSWGREMSLICLLLSFASEMLSLSELVVLPIPSLLNFLLSDSILIHPLNSIWTLLSVEWLHSLRLVLSCVSEDHLIEFIVEFPIFLLKLLNNCLQLFLILHLLIKDISQLFKVFLKIRYLSIFEVEYLEWVFSLISQIVHCSS